MNDNENEPKKKESIIRKETSEMSSQWKSYSLHDW